MLSAVTTSTESRSPAALSPSKRERESCLLIPCSRLLYDRISSLFPSLLPSTLARPLDPFSRWTTVTELVSLNTPPLANGLLYIYINNTLVLAQTGLVWRTDESVILSRVLFSTFFGGSSKSYYPPKDEQAFFKEFTVS